jgi:hypothetical protein
MTSVTAVVRGHRQGTIAANIFSDFFKNLNDGIALIRDKMEDAELMKQILIKV